MGSKGDAVGEHARSTLPERAAHDFDLFVVHAAADADFVHGYLLPELNLPSPRVLLVDKLTPGASIVAEIDRGVSRSRFTVAVLSPAYLADRWAVFGEQLASHLSVEDARVIPLRLTDVKLPLHLEARVSLEFIDQARWESEAARLRELLHTAAPVAEQIPCPYPGMRPFAEHEASRFFGRDDEIDELIGRLDRGEREIYVIGPSGSGKSSLVQAGLLHVLNTGSSRLERSFVVRTMRPGERPTDRLAQALEGELATPATTVSALVARHHPAERVLVFVDQLEKLFTLANATERQRFIATLQVLRAERQCCLLLALRADFYGALMDSMLWPELTGVSRLDVAPLRGAALAQAIAVLTVFSVGTSVLGVVAWRQRQEAHRFLGRTYLKTGRTLLTDGHPMKALPYFVAARAEATEDPVLRMLFAQASRNLPLTTFVDHDSFISGATFNRDGTRVIVSSIRSNTVQVWNASTNKPITLPLKHQRAVLIAAFSADGTRVVTVSEDMSARVWDVSTEKWLTPPLKQDGFIYTVAFSPDGTRVITTSNDRRASR